MISNEAKGARRGQLIIIIIINALFKVGCFVAMC